MSDSRKVTINLGGPTVTRIESIATATGTTFNDALLRALGRGIKSLEPAADAAAPPDNDDAEARQFGYKILDAFG